MSLRYNPFTGTLDLVGGTSANIWEKVSSTVPALNTVAVDTLANTEFKSLKYIITTYNETNSAYRSIELSVLNNNGSYRETRSHRLQVGGLSVAIDTFNNAGTFELRITNNESYDVQVEIGRLVLN